MYTIMLAFSSFLLQAEHSVVVKAHNTYRERMHVLVPRIDSLYSSTSTLTEDHDTFAMRNVLPGQSLVPASKDHSSVGCYLELEQVQ